jgi:hypothetical protein
VTTLQRFNCRAYDWLLLRCDDSLLFNYGEELRTTFRDELAVALERGPSALLRLWCFLIYDTLTVVGPEYLKALSVAAGAIITAGVLVLGTALGFCSLHGISVVQGCERFEGQSITPPGNSLGRSVLLSNGHSMFLECSGDPHPGPTVILATGRGLGSYEAWSLVQARITPFAHVCSFDPLGYGKSDHVPGDHPVDEVAANMHDLFSAAHLNGPYILVGASLGGVLIRRYEQLYPLESQASCSSILPTRRWSGAMRRSLRVSTQVGTTQNTCSKMVCSQQSSDSRGAMTCRRLSWNGRTFLHAAHFQG